MTPDHIANRQWIKSSKRWTYDDLCAHGLSARSNYVQNECISRGRPGRFPAKSLFSRSRGGRATSATPRLPANGAGIDDSPTLLRAPSTPVGPRGCRRPLTTAPPADNPLHRRRDDGDSRQVAQQRRPRPVAGRPRAPPRSRTTPRRPARHVDAGNHAPAVVAGGLKRRRPGRAASPLYNGFSPLFIFLRFSMLLLLFCLCVD
uniref:Uncharacterized protein n=1 Tax=Leersia perrieri TaxID=77586 RepID=A0A0D9XWA3_9ORYZ